MGFGLYRFESDIPHGSLENPETLYRLILREKLKLLKEQAGECPPAVKVSDENIPR
jgi:hypothetical protein